MKTFAELCGITAPNQTFDYPAIAERLQDGLGSRLVLPPATWGAALLAVFDMHRGLWADGGDPEDDRMVDDLECLAELFQNRGWRHRKFVELFLLGWDESELPQEKAIPEEWQQVDSWWPLAISGGWTLETFPAAQGELIRVSYFDEGYSLRYWLAGCFDMPREGDL